MRRIAKKPKEWKQKLRKEDKLELLRFGTGRDVTRIEFKKCCDREGRHCLARRQVDKVHERFRVKFTSGDKNGCMGVNIEKLLKYVRTIWWGVRIAKTVDTEDVRGQRGTSIEG